MKLTHQQIKDLINDTSKFRKWLENRKEEVVGVQAEPCNCPVANFLSQALGGEEIIVTDKIDHESFEIRLFIQDTWVTKFVRQLDNKTWIQDGVTGEFCLQILDNLNGASEHELPKV